MKMKEYITPSVEAVEIEDMQLLAGSGVTADGIDYGGVDDEGTLDPTAPGLEIDPLSELFAF